MLVDQSLSISLQILFLAIIEAIGMIVLAFLLIKWYQRESLCCISYDLRIILNRNSIMIKVLHL